MSPNNIKKLVFLLAIILGLGAWYMLNGNFQNAEIAEITPPELQQLLTQQAQQIALIDVRTPEEYKLEHIPEAISIPLNDVESKLPEIGKLAANHKIVTYCASGKRSHKALQILKQHQIEGTNLTGGFDAWWKFKQQ